MKDALVQKESHLTLRIVFVNQGTLVGQILVIVVIIGHIEKEIDVNVVSTSVIPSLPIQTVYGIVEKLVLGIPFTMNAQRNVLTMKKRSKIVTEQKYLKKTLP